MVYGNVYRLFRLGMIPNVYGMATYSDGGLMSTKPYTCGSNYILKMSNYSRGEWCEIVDGLYWNSLKSTDHSMKKMLEWVFLQEA